MSSGVDHDDSKKASLREWKEKNAQRRLNDPEYDQQWRSKKAAYMREYRKRNPQRIRAVMLKVNYGMTLDEYDLLLGAQNGKCAICDEPPKEVRRGRHATLSEALDVDHDPNGGTIRGLLCQSCNRGLAELQDDPSRLKKAIAYLEAPPSTLVGMSNRRAGKRLSSKTS